MALPLKKLDVLIKGNSTITIDDAMDWVKNWVDERQDASDNLDEDGNQIEAFYADLFDSRDSSQFKVFSYKATDEREISNSFIKEDGKKVLGVITVFIKEDLKEEIISSLGNISETSSYNITMTSNPEIIEDDFDYLVAETEEELAELRILDNKIYAYDAGAFAEEKQLLNIEETNVELKILIIKGK
jgi:hypothetical protein